MKPKSKKPDGSSRAPRYHLDAYRKFIREASPYISVIAGRRVKPSEAESMSDQQVTEIALLIDDRVAELK